jgi:anti-sigma B factor antagonist
MSLSYAMRQIGDVTVLDLSGRVSLTETPTGPGGEVLLHELVRYTVKTGSKKILINLRDVTYIDSSGLGELVACSTTAYNQGADMKVCNANPRVNNLLVITSLRAVLSAYPDEEAGLQAFRQLKNGSSAA